jgi:hypothetical protein
MLALGTESDSVMGPQHPGMLSEAADARCSSCTIARTYVWVQLMLRAKVRSERTY